MLDERCGASVRPASSHASRICVNAAAIASRSPSIVHAPSTPSAQCAARAIAFGPITPAMIGSGSCTGRGPTGSAPSNGGSPAQIRRMRATCSSMRCHRRSNEPPMAR